MADLKPSMRHVDNEPLIENGHRGRFVLPSNPPRTNGRPVPVREDSCYSRFVTPERTARFFSVRHGDTSANERANPFYAGVLANMPPRAMIGYEGDGARIVPVGKKLFMEYGINFEAIMPKATEKVSARGLYLWWGLNTQWNEGPILSKGAKRWRSPIAEQGFGWEKGVFQMHFICRKEPATPDDQGETAFEFKVPVAFREYKVRMECVDGKGGDGMFAAWLEGEKLFHFEGQNGYRNFGNPYAGHGLYCAPNVEGTRTVRIQNFREGLMAA